MRCRVITQVLCVSVALALVAGLSGPARAQGQGQGVIVDHTSLHLFDQIPSTYIQAAAALSMMFVDRSVGANINDALTCLSYPTDEAAPAHCKRWEHWVPQFSSPPSSVNWSRPGGYNRANWHYYGWPGVGIPPDLPCGVETAFWHQQLDCFIRFVDSNPTAYRVYGWQHSYLEVTAQSDIASQTTGFFVNQPNRVDVTDFESLQSRHPSRIFILHTTSLARAIGTPVSRDFNERLRTYVRQRGGYLLDVADIEAHDPSGNPCYDNRDGVPYVVNGELRENHPNDGQNIPALCQHYTGESEGGHLTSPGKIRIGKAFWILMARIAGWNPGGTSNSPSAPTGFRILTTD